MNTRILRMCRRMPFGKCRLVEGMGQLQPVLFGVEGERGVTLRIEGVADRYRKPSWCWWVLPLSTCKAQAKAVFGELEACHANGTESSAARLWREHQERRGAALAVAA